MAERPFNPDFEPVPEEKAGSTPPRPEQIWPPPAPSPAPTPAPKPSEASPNAAPAEEEAHELDWTDEVGKIDEAIEEIRRINGSPAVENEIPLSPAGSLAPFMVAGSSEPKPPPRDHGPMAQTTRTVRPKAENEIAQLWGNVFFSAEQPAPKVIVVTAARKGDGATQIAAALAMVGAGASDELRICLVDFNIRKPAVADLLGIKNQPGVTDVLTGQCGLVEAVHSVTLKNGKKLFVLPAGALHDQPLGLIKSRLLKSLIAQLRDRFDHTIIDAACVNVYPDAQIIAAQSDGALLVVHAGDTPRETVAEAKKRFDHAGARCLGLVMNQRTDPIPSLLYKMT